MKALIKEINNVKKSNVKKKVDSRIKEFNSFKRKKSHDIFKELCFCILTANSTAQRCINVHNNIGDDFLNLNPKQLQKRLKEAGARFHTKRAGYISEARRYKDNLKNIINHFKDDQKLRAWIVKNVKGIGYKEASHFLRNIGYSNLAILDFHIIDNLAKNKIVQRPKNLNKERYIE